MTKNTILVMDIGGTFIKYAILDEEACFIERFSSLLTPYQREDYINTLLGLVEEHKDQIDGVAISTTGIIDEETGVYKESGSFPFIKSYSLKQAIEADFNLPCWVINDGQAALYGEIWKGKLQDQNHAILITVGTGIVCGFLLNGQTYFGAHGMAGELSSVTHDEYEGYFPVKYSSSHFIEQASRLLDLDKEQDGQAVFEHLYQGNPHLDQLFESYCHRLALLIFNLHVTLDPELIVLSGGISQQDLFIDEVRRQTDHIYKMKSEPYLGPSKLQITASAFKSDANLLGALYYFQRMQDKDEE